MKYLSEIIEDKQSALFKKYDVFFAFSNDQLEEGLKKTRRTKEEMTTTLGMGMIIPKEHVTAFMDEHTTIIDKGIAEDIAQEGIEAVVRRELYNHEAFYTGDISSTVDSLDSYPVDATYVHEVYKKEQQNPDSWKNL